MYVWYVYLDQVAQVAQVAQGKAFIKGQAIQVIQGLFCPTGPTGPWDDHFNLWARDDYFIVGPNGLFFPFLEEGKTWQRNDLSKNPTLEKKLQICPLAAFSKAGSSDIYSMFPGSVKRKPPDPNK